MKCTDLSLENMQEVRGGRLVGGNTIAQSSANGGAFGSALVSGAGFNLSPVTIDSQVSQLNTTTQAAAISDLRERTLTVGIEASQLQFGGLFGRLR